MTFGDDDLPVFFKEADAGSLAGQHLTVRLSAARLLGALGAAVGGAIAGATAGAARTACASVAVAGFATALVAEILMLLEQPERDWYAGRALAESAKTLGWRFAVKADPFGSGVTDEAATDMMYSRLSVVAKEGRDRLDISGNHPVVTPRMKELRASSFEIRKATYLNHRTAAQLRWYSDRARRNRRRAKLCRWLLIIGEVTALMLSVAIFFTGWRIDLSAILASGVTAMAAWLALKQYVPLASAYATTAAELAIQHSALSRVSSREWSQAVADAEEAISREHTMWLASRSTSD